MATLKELAAYSGYSVATVSRILNNDPTMAASEETRKKVLEAAGALGYEKSRRSRGGKSLRFGLAEMLSPAEQLDDPYYLYLKNFVAQECLERRIDLIPLQQEAEGFVQLLPAVLDGVIAIGIFTVAQIESLRALSENLVFLDSSPDEAHCDSVVINYRLGIEQALDHLFELGHRQIGFIGPSTKYDDWKRPAPELRRQLFIHFMSERNAYDSRYLIDAPTNAADTVAALGRHLRAGKPLPTAFLTANEENAIGTMRALQAAGLHVPRDVSIISFNDTPLSELFDPPLTSISTHVQEMGRMAVQLAVDRAPRMPSARKLPVKVILPPALVLRGSAAGLPEMHEFTGMGQ